MSSSSILGGVTLPNNAALAERRRVVLSAGYLAYAGASDTDIGALCNSTFTTDKTGVVESPNVGVAQLLVADGVISQFANVYAGATGYISASGTLLIGVALEAATAAGDQIFVWRFYPAGSGSSDTSANTSAAAFTAGSGTTTPKGAIGSQAAGTGNFTGTFKPPATLTANRAYTAPEDSDQTLVGATATQTLTNKTLTSPVLQRSCGATVTAAGANQGAATALNEGEQVLVTGVTGQTGYGVKLPSASFAGKRVIVQNITAFACKLYPYSTEDIGAGASTAVTIAASHAYLVVFSAVGVGRVYDLGAQITS